MKRFTLIELLVVIAIIAILTSILLPSLTRIKQKGVSAVCLSQVRNLQMAHMICTKNNDYKFPRNRDGGVIARRASTESLKKTKIYQYLNTPTIYKCPGDPVPKTIVPMHEFQSYGFNGYLNDTNTRGHVDSLLKIEKSSSEVIGFLDEAGNVVNGFDPLFRNYPADWAGAWHLRGYNTSYLDGSAKHIKTTNSLSSSVLNDMIINLSLIHI